MSIKIEGIEELFRKLDQATAVQTLVPPMQRAVLRLQSRMANYPPAPPRSRYRRTGTLGRRWTTRVTQESDGVRGTVGNNTVYGPLVQSSRFQTRIHQRTGWQTDRSVLEEERDAIVADFQRAISEALRR